MTPITLPEGRGTVLLDCPDYHEVMKVAVDAGTSPDLIKNGLTQENFEWFHGIMILKMLLIYEALCRSGPGLALFNNKLDDIVEALQE